ncbi:Conserved oligomeric Golgi complex subunit 2 [Psilocybe cubensis]|uniref:Conserved oligomeric Golgi complex subunit 2 n=1 Tax=Psilocybe cubensis TaxID=181762 RepID=A0ACB8HBV1_PSICU|nr:Conserved oligomeric Golgi complex subunit 2 [Psilocybe cubensis]KAH9485421.1 Conserved oligomeric Golgi complex subunit 2 [Psilocybe cubensis]
MSTNSDTDLSFRDPFRLDRLADELATRESTHPAPLRLSGEINSTLELPEHVPLSHNDQFLSAKDFNVEQFLLSRAHISLPDLRTELRQYLAKLKEELVKLINDDYEAFISLSTDLRDEGARLERLKYPLESLKGSALESKTALQAIQNDIHDKLTKRARLREEKALLHLLLKISESVLRLESLLLISSPDQISKESMEMNNAKFLIFPSHSEDHSDEKLRGNRAKHLGRVSAEYTQLLYYVRKAQDEECAFTREIQWRIDRIHATLSSDLDQLFAHTLALITNSKSDYKVSDLEKNKWMADLTECLKTYDALGLWRDAEDVIRREVVRPFVKKTIYPGALAESHSPIVPRTPFHSSGASAPPMTSTLSTHQIPYTPFTAFVPRTNLYYSMDASTEMPQAQLLENTDDPLTRLLNRILRFVERDISRIMVTSEKVSMKSGSSRSTLRTSLLSETSRCIDNDEFQIMANVIWAEIAQSIMSDLGTVVFAAGRANEFHKHYETTQAFIRSLEHLAPSIEAVRAMRQHPLYLAFERRWQLPVYFQLRWKEIVGALEDTFAAETVVQTTRKGGSYIMPQGSAAWMSMTACWSSEIYIPELSHRFWRLTLQGTVSQNQTRGTHPLEPVTDATASDDVFLQRCSAAIIDIKTMETNVGILWRQTISVIIPDASVEESLEMESALQESISQLTSIIPSTCKDIVTILTKRCCEGLLHVRSIPSQFRAMSNKRMPAEPSYFMGTVLRPIKHYFAIGVADGPGSPLKDSFLKEISSEIFDNVTQKYIGYLMAMKKTEEGLKKLKKGKKSTFSLFGNAPNLNDEAKDEERIRTQMILDVEAFGKDGESLSVEVGTNKHFLALKEMVYASDI